MEHHMNYFKNIFSLIIILIISACVAPKSTFSINPDTNLNAYRYIIVDPPKYDGGYVDRYNLASQLEDLFRREGFTIIAKNQVAQLNKNELIETLVCQIAHFHTPDGMGGSYATVNLNIFNINTDNVYTGKGIYQGLLTVSEDLTGALKQAFNGFITSYTGFNPSFVKKPADKFKNWETLEWNKTSLTKYFDMNIHNLNPIEGIWTSAEDNNYKIGIIRDTSNINRDFVAIIIETEHMYWKPKQVKIEFEKTAYPKVYSTTYYMGDHSKKGATSFIDDIGFLKIESVDTKYIKNYPPNIDGYYDGELTGSTPSHTIATGSGFVISKTGLVVTNYHVIQGKTDIEVVFPTLNKTVSASVTLKDKNNDIVILSLKDFHFQEFYNYQIPFIIPKSTDLRLGQDVYTLGFPLGKFLGKSAKLSTGTVNSLFGINDDPRVIQISNPIQPGNSGGPLFNKNGELVGIVVASLNAKYFYENEDIMPQNVNFAIKSSYLSNLVSMLPEDQELTTRYNKLANKNLEDQIELITPFIVTIKAK